MSQDRLSQIHEEIGRIHRRIEPLRKLLELPQLVADKTREETPCSSSPTWQSKELVSAVFAMDRAKHAMASAIAEVLTARCAEVEAALRAVLQARLERQVHELSSLLAESASYALSLREVKKKDRTQ